MNPRIVRAIDRGLAPGHRSVGKETMWGKGRPTKCLQRDEMTKLTKGLAKSLPRKAWKTVE